MVEPIRGSPRYPRAPQPGISAHVFMPPIPATRFSIT